MTDHEEEMYAAAERIRAAAESLRTSIAERGWDDKATQKINASLIVAVMDFDKASGHLP